MVVDWPSFGLGVVAGLVVGAVIVLVWHRHADHTQLALAWAISLSWLFWHVGNGLGVIEGAPAAVFDVVAGASVGIVLGEKFFENLLRLRK